MFGVFGGVAAQPWMAAVSAREGANGGGPVKEDGLFTVSRDGVVTEQCLEGEGGCGGEPWKQTDKGHYRNRKRGCRWQGGV